MSKFEITLQYKKRVTSILKLSSVVNLHLDQKHPLQKLNFIDPQGIKMVLRLIRDNFYPVGLLLISLIVHALILILQFWQNGSAVDTDLLVEIFWTRFVKLMPWVWIKASYCFAALIFVSMYVGSLYFLALWLEIINGNHDGEPVSDCNHASLSNRCNRQAVRLCGDNLDTPMLWKKTKKGRNRRRRKTNKKETARNVLVQKLRLRCPQCSKLPTTNAKIYQCTFGHLICNHCQESYNQKCLLCKHCKTCDSVHGTLHRSLVTENLMKSDVFDKKSKKAITTVEEELAESIDFQCPVCLEVPEGEVVQCSNGHVICKRCWKRVREKKCHSPYCRTGVKDCPKCRAHFKGPPARCVIFERMVTEFDIIET